MIPEADATEARQLFVEEYIKKSGGRADRALTRFLADEAISGVSWLVGLGAECLDPRPAHPLRTAAPGSFRRMPKVLKVARAPLYALYPLQPGITQTFGGLKINTSYQVLETDRTPIRGLYAAGEIAGGFFSIDYVGGGSLTRCVITGRAAGKNAAKEA